MTTEASTNLHFCSAESAIHLAFGERLPLNDTLDHCSWLTVKWHQQQLDHKPSEQLGHLPWFLSKRL
uniref:Uncharacterized protein n=1 Tax=Oryza sativa subsp. japonica TaxID=39947 RepID=Q69P86_ORYSJ|nr:hypothetical protein [Oryza sativa Japonica Group]